MKTKRFYFTALLLSLALLLGGCIHPDETPPAGTGNAEVPTLPEMPELEHFYDDAVYTYQSNVNEEILMTGLSKAYLVLANKTYVLGEDYVPEELVTLTCRTTYPMKLESRAAEALYEMMDEMTAAGITNTLVTSAYRSYARQVELFNGYLQHEQSTISEEAYEYFDSEYLFQNYLSQGKTKLSVADARKVVLSYSAEPGTSEHQTGLCIDFITEEMAGNLNTDFENYKVFTWLSENAYQFGFILRYPKGKEGITGYTYEPWHYRFVGREVATDIHYSGLTLEEYLGAVQG